MVGGIPPPLQVAGIGGGQARLPGGGRPEPTAHTHLMAVKPAVQNPVWCRLTTAEAVGFRVLGIRTGRPAFFGVPVVDRPPAICDPDQYGSPPLNRESQRDSPHRALLCDSA